MTGDGPSPGSFRDPAGFVFRREGVHYRQVNQAHQRHYDFFLSSGLYASLLESGLIVPHEEVDVAAPEPAIAYRLLRPEPLDYISYPYEWCPGQLRDAALATLEIQQRALEFGMSLRDASAYNIQFHRGRPLLIDTLSFEIHDAGRPWVAYRQYCQHFLAPLALSARVDVRLAQLARIHVDGVPLDLASRLLPFVTRAEPGLLAHVHLHARWQQRHAHGGARGDARGIGRTAQLGLLDSLQSTTRGLEWRPTRSAWGDYYEATNYVPAAFEHKRELVARFLERAAPRTVWDLGANTGVFSRLASARGIPTLAFDFDPAAVEKSYRACRAGADPCLLPLCLDLTNPTPGVGWLNRERTSWLDRGPADTVLALALVHHLAIANNVPLEMLAEFFARLGRALIIEFVPRGDSQVERLLASREDIFGSYTQQAFETAFGRVFRIDEREPLRDSQRVLYRMSRRD